VRIFNEFDASKIPWGQYKVDFVCESTGMYLTKEKATVHL